MPVWMWQFHLKSIEKFLKDQLKDREERQKSQGQQLSKKITGPNIQPSSTYNFKK